LINPYLSPSHFTLPLPFRRDVNKKLSYSRQSTLSIIKSSRHAISNENVAFKKRAGVLHIVLTAPPLPRMVGMHLADALVKLKIAIRK